MWLVGYWMGRGHKPEEILKLSPKERTVWQAIAELNTEKRKEELRDAFLEAVSFLLSKSEVES